MNKEFFSCINVWIETGDGLHEWLENFADDAEFLKEAISVNLLDCECSQQTQEEIAAFCARFPENTKAFSLPEQTDVEAYNAVCGEACCCSFINFTNTSVHLTASALRQLQEQILLVPDFPVYSFYPVFIQPDGSRKPYLPYKAKNYIHHLKAFKHFSMFLPGYMFSSSLMANRKFSEQAPEDADVLFLVRALVDAEKYVLTKVKLGCEEPFENDYYNYRRQYSPAWYTDSLRQVYLPLLKEYPNVPFIQAMTMYQVAVRFACNRNDRNKSLLQGEQLDEFFSVLTELLALIDDNYIAAYNMNEMKMLPKYMGMVFLRFKYQNPGLLPSIADDGKGHYVAVHNNAYLDNHTTLTASVLCMDYSPKTQELVIDGKINNAYVFDYNKISCCTMIRQQKQLAQPTPVYSLDKYFGISMYKDFTFQFRFTLEDLKDAPYLGFWFEYGDLSIKLPIAFPRMESRLVNKFPHSYWCFDKYMMTYSKSKKELCLSERKSSRIFRQELLLYKDFLAKSPKKERIRACKSILLRMGYYLTKPFFRKKQVWITFDQLFKGGDNGEYFFRYVSDNHADKVDMYYVANADCADYQRLKKTYSKLLPFNSLKEKLIVLHADCVFATRVDVKQYCGFGPQLEYYHRGLMNYDVFCLQHGLTIQRIAQYQNRLFDNTKLYFCVSPNEISNLNHPVYNYDPEMLVLTGAPRYDGLINDDKKQILIAPTWRRNVTAGTNKKGHTHEYSINFKNTEYYRIYNGLINNQELIDCAKETGYRIIYLVHPILSPQVDDFQGPEQVTILPGARGDVSYEKMMCQSSLMLTDHSGIQFDFASMRKPLIYYHPDTLPPQYDAGGMDYETQAFGPVCRNETEVVAALCKAMRSNCQMEEQYRARVDAFFAFDDHDNCKRIFEAAAKHQGLDV